MEALDTAGLEGPRSPAILGRPIGAFEGEPGLGSDGLDLPLVCGVCICALGCLAPGPTDWLNIATEGVEGGDRKLESEDSGRAAFFIEGVRGMDTFVAR